MKLRRGFGAIFVSGFIVLIISNVSFDSILMYENVDTTSYFRDTVKNALDASNATTTVNKTAAVNMQTANNQETPYIRAALGYLPYDKLDIYGAQLRWFVHSWREMLKHQDPDWRTDVVVVSEAADLEIFHGHAAFVELLGKVVQIGVCIILP